MRDKMTGAGSLAGSALQLRLFMVLSTLYCCCCCCRGERDLEMRSFLTDFCLGSFLAEDDEDFFSFWCWGEPDGERLDPDEPLLELELDELELDRELAELAELESELLLFADLGIILYRFSNLNV
jgi:hypothetical protein